MVDWQYTKLGDLIQIKYGKDHKEIEDGDFPCFGTGGVMRNVKHYLFDGPSVLIPRKGSLDNVMFYDGKFWTVDTMFWSIVNQEKCLPKFLYYQISRMELSKLNVGSAVPSLTVKVLNEIQLNVPSIKEQQAIADVLSSIDDKIDLLNRQNETLEAMAQTLFRQWFIEDWKNKGLSNGILGDLFVTIESGKRPKGGIDSRIRDVPSIGAENVKGIGKHDYSKEKYVSFDYYNSMKKGRISDGDILVYKDGGTPGEFKPKFGMVGKGFPHNQACINEHVFRCVPKTSSRCYSFALLNTAMVNFELEERGTGAAIPGINGSAFKSVPVFIPSIEALNDFEMTAGPFYDKILTNALAIRELGEFRDTLLPKLMSGEVRVKLD